LTLVYVRKYDGNASNVSPAGAFSEVSTVTNGQRQRPSVWLTLSWILVPWLVLIGTSLWMADGRLSSLTSVLSRENVLGAATLAATASAVPIAFAIWGRRPWGVKAAEALGGQWESLMMACSAVLCLTAFFLVKGDVPFGVVANGVLAAALSGLVWLLGAVSERVPRNIFIGFRTRRTLSDDAAWKDANLRHGRRLRFASPVGLLGILIPPYGAVVAMLPAVVVGILFLLEDVRARSMQ
jgi:hypothetical protein